MDDLNETERALIQSRYGGECCGQCRFFACQEQISVDRFTNGSSLRSHLNGVCRYQPQSIAKFGSEWCGKFEKVSQPRDYAASATLSTHIGRSI